MSEFNFDVAGGESIRLATAGKYCDRDIVVTGTGGGGDTTAEDGIIDRTLSGAYENSRVTKVSHSAFRDCAKLTSVSFPNVTSISDYAFQNCSALTSVSFPNATSAENYVFQYCEALTSVYCPSLKRIGTSGFHTCSALTSADFPSATYISSYGFQNCGALASINLPVLTSINTFTFRGCTQLTSADFPAAQRINNYAFQNCSNLTSLILRNTTVATLGDTNAFTGTPIESGTGYVYVPDNLVEDYKVATNWATYANQIKPISELGE